MAEAPNALVFRNVPCPSCKATTSQGEIKTGMYAEEGRETDQHVTGYRWLRPDIPPVHPPFYVLLHCPQCAFTDFVEDFRDPERSRENRVHRIAPKLRPALTRVGSAVRVLHQQIGPLPIQFPTALRLHLLAIAVQELMPEESRDYAKVARLYLRVAWLYREQGSAAGPSVVESETLDALDQFAARLKDLRGAGDRLATICKGTEGEAGVAGLVRQIDALDRGYAGLRPKLLPAGGGANSLDFLALLRGEWPGIPASEPQALEAAIQAYEKVYQEGEGDTVALLKLLIELNYRLNRIDRVLEYAASLSKTGYEERTQLQRKLAGDRSLSAEERNRLNTRINRITAALDLSAEIRREALARQKESTA